MTGPAILCIVWSAFLALVGLGMGLVWLVDQTMTLIQVVDDEYRRRVFGLGPRVGWSD